MTEITNALHQALLRIAERARDYVQDEAPYRTGDLRASHTVQSLGPGNVEMGTNWDYAVFVHEGTGLYGPRKQRIRPKNKKALYWPGAAHPVKSVAGQRPNPYMERVRDRVVGDVENIAAPLIGDAAAAQLRRVVQDITVRISL
jgi:hypothetical protein